MHSGLKLDKMYIIGNLYTILAQFIIFKQMNTNKLINIDVLKNYIIMYCFFNCKYVCMCTFYYFLHIWRMSLNFLNKLKMWILVFKVNLATLFCWLSNRPMVYGRQLCNLRSCWVPQLVWTLMFFRTENEPQTTTVVAGCAKNKIVYTYTYIYG